MLPLEQEAREVAWLDRLDLAAQALERVAMDAREQMALAPFDAACVALRIDREGRRIGRAHRREPALQHRTFGFQREQRRVDIGLRQQQLCCEREGRRRTHAAQARTQQIANCFVA